MFISSCRLLFVTYLSLFGLSLFVLCLWFVECCVLSFLVFSCCFVVSSFVIIVSTWCPLLLFVVCCLWVGVRGVLCVVCCVVVVVC